MSLSRRCFCTLLFAPPLLFAQKRQRGLPPPSPPIVEILEITARRTSDGIIEFDGKLRNSGEKPARGLKLIFHILAPGKETLSTQKGTIDEPVLDPGQEAEFHWQMRDHVRAVHVTLGAADRSDFILKVQNPGPYPIE